ncbi:MAG: carboxylating nicotinate-nucleotide diphosphorylase [Burkholderiales bacterium]
MMIDKKYLENFIAMALAEDIGTGDITTQSTVPQHAVIQGKFLAKAAGVLCGTEVAKAVFCYIDPDIKVEFCFSDGQAVKNGDVIGTISGSAAGVLQGERLALNMMQRMSGIATKTSEAVAKVAGFPVRILDTRKVTPGLRVFEKYAVRTGGGHNHRFSLADGVLIKDNHIKAAGGITNAVKAAKALAPITLKIEVETETLEQVAEALSAGADIIMLDNMSIDMMRQAVALIDKKALVEASGNMDEKDLREVAATGVDFISIGALTNSPKPLDISLKFL